MKRKIIDELIKWKEDKNRKPLIVHGARQVGKTYVIREFGKGHYKNIIYVNFEIDLELAKDFTDNISPEFIVNRMELYFGETIKKGETLIFFDEIQACGRALTSLKYFCEDAPEYHVIAAGSLLGVAINKEKYSFPVGKVSMMNLYPMDFEEFLWAQGRELVANEIRRCYSSNEEMSQSIHGLCMEQYKTYLIVGGMPGVIKRYIEEQKVIETQVVKNEILSSYTADMSKYATNSEATKIKASYDSIPSQLAKDNKKFQYKVIQKGGTATMFGEAIHWLEAAGVVLKCFKIEHGHMPPRAYRDLSSFKLYMSDIGLLTLKANLPLHALMSSDTNNSTFIGALTENYVAQALLNNGFDLHYWTSKDTAEVDFVIQKESDIIPVEVKANENVKSRSLSVYISKYKPPYAIRISAKNFGFENNIKSVPLYAVFCIENKNEKKTEMFGLVRIT
ncbi:MAG TPA: ATPase [Clostridiales bacterium]|nr:MAG: ATPase [Clostridiales bacterium GWD2_32_19]HCC07782.1 ATPase [Clostridiales bacterium]